MKNYLSLIKFSHTVFALPFAIVGFLLGIIHSGQIFSPILFVKMILCMVFARSAAMAFNRFLDRDIDAKNPRTLIREIPAGILKARAVLVFTILCSLAFIGTTYFINAICFYLSPVALFIILFYSYTKRFTKWCHFVLGAGLSLAPIGAYLTVTGSCNVLPILLSLIVLTWVAGFDIIYALQDDEFDKKNNLHSIPSSFGRKYAIHLSNGLHIVSAMLLFFFISAFGFNIFLIVGATIFAGLLIYQHVLVKANDLTKINIAFFTTNGYASILFAACFGLYYFMNF